MSAGPNRTSVWLYSVGLLVAFVAGRTLSVESRPRLKKSDTQEGEEATTPAPGAGSTEGDSEPPDIDHHNEIRARAERLPFVRDLRAQSPTVAEVQPYRFLRRGSNQYVHHFTANTLTRKDRLGMWPLMFEDAKAKVTYTVIHIGRSLCGHDRIVHGGLIATILDEALARSAIPALPGAMGFTANLNINYRRPLQADQFYVVATELEKVEGRKAWVKAKFSTSVGQDAPVYADATALFVAPRPTPASQTTAAQSDPDGPQRQSAPI